MDYKSKVKVPLNPQNVCMILSKRINKTMELRLIIFVYRCVKVIAAHRAVVYHRRFNVLHEGAHYIGLRALLFSSQTGEDVM